MEKLLIIGCKKAMDDVCIGFSRCLVGFIFYAKRSRLMFRDLIEKGVTDAAF